MDLGTEVVYKTTGSAFPIRRVVGVARSSPENVEQVKRKDRGGTEATPADPTSRDQGPLKQKDFEGGTGQEDSEVRAARNRATRGRVLRCCRSIPTRDFEMKVSLKNVDDRRG